MAKQFVQFFIISFLLHALLSCEDEELGPPEPQVSFVSFNTFSTDSAHLIFSFEDGDGNIGLYPNETEAPYEFNAYFTYSELVNGEWVDLDLGDLVNYRIPILKESDKPKQIQGEVQITIFDYFDPTESALSDTFRWSGYILDRDLNQSNTFESDAYIKPVD